jgi:hypothetical protein
MHVCLNTGEKRALLLGSFFLCAMAFCFQRNCILAFPVKNLDQIKWSFEAIINYPFTSIGLYKFL